ncbi:phage portal protein family protein [Glutamicibacter arilaitensis]|uniref:phage portal protein family protein n=1 Tax=Glutamicibacter arilaitensis TaxID=256701 RepID=UPI003FD4BF42
MAETKIGKEAGSPGGFEPTKQGSTTVYLTTPVECNAELAFPNNIPVFDKMRADSQVESVLNAIQLPIMSAQWDLHTDGVDDNVVQLVRTELGLPEPGTAMAGRQRRQGISWKQHLREVLTMLWAGFMPFEQVYEIAPARPDQEGLGLSKIIHLRKLAPRMPRLVSITS